jgi:diacylglycerol kinase family enzyme
MVDTIFGAVTRGTGNPFGTGINIACSSTYAVLCTIRTRMQDRIVAAARSWFLGFFVLL